MNKEKVVNTSAESSKKKRKIKRLDGMLESMNSRSDPVSTHRIATEYFQSFRTQRNIDKKEETISNTAIGTAVTSAVNTAVYRQFADTSINILNKKKVEDLLHTRSEEKVYNAIKCELKNIGDDRVRLGITKLKKITGLSDKTIRVAIHNLINKRSIRILRPSVGIYGRMYYIPPIQEVMEERINKNISIDKNTKSIIPQ